MTEKNDRKPRTTPEYAFAYIAGGYMPIPVNYATKRPCTKGWQDLRLTEEDTPRYFNGAAQNIGILLGEPSGNLIDIDLDCSETVALAPQFLPPTRRIFGRPSKRASHWLYRTEPVLKTTKYADPVADPVDGSMLVEIRSTGCQTIFPPSTHPTGERITFDQEGDPAHIGGDELQASVAQLASAALLARHWPSEGSRHDAALALAGALIGAGWHEDDATNFVQAVAEAAGDDEIEDRLQAVATTATRYDGDDEITGLPTLGEIIGDKVVRKIKQWLTFGALGDIATAEGSDPVIDELNQKHAVVMVGGKCRVMNEEYDPVLKRPMITFSTTSEFNAFHRNKYARDGVTLGNYWLAHPNRREYDGIVFDPEWGTDDRYYNMWRGFAVEPKEGDCSLYLDHIRDVIACGDEAVYNYIVACMADAVQNPAKRPGTAIVLRGKQGVGKGVFATQFGKLFGAHFVHVYHHRHLTGNFNSHLKDALIVFADEAFWAGDKSGEGVLKSLVTEEVLTVEFKGIDPIPVKNHIRLLVASNSDWVVPAGLEERRFCVLDVSDSRMQDHAYFGAVVDQMNSGGREALLAFLKDYDLSNVDLREFPKTEALREQKVMSMSPTHQWWLACLERGFVLEGDAWTASLPKDAVYKDYMDHADAIRVRRRAGQTEFGIAMRKLVPGARIVRRTINGGRPWCYTFPSLAECREEFDTQMQVPGYKWPEEEEDAECPTSDY